MPLATPTHRDESTLGIFAATLSSGHTLVLIEHKVRLTDTALLAAGADSGAGDLTVVGARRQAGGKAVRKLAVGRAPQS